MPRTLPWLNGNENPEKYWDFEALKNPPAYVVDHDPLSEHENMTSIIFDGVMENGRQTKVFAYIAYPDGPVPEGGWPGIVLVHGGGGTAFAWAVELWRSYGYAVIAPDWYGRRPVNTDQIKEAGELIRPYVAFERPHRYNNQTGHISNAANLVLAHSLLLSLDKVNPEKTAYAGLSWGSWYGAMVTAIDPRFKGIIEIYLGDRKDIDLFINGRFLHAAKCPMYYVAGTNDLHGFPSTLQAGFEACGPMLGNRSVIVALPHSHQGFRYPVCRRYADAILYNAPGLPLIGATVIDGNTISAAVEYEGKGIQKTFLCFTCDRHEAIPARRKWEMIPAQYCNGRMSAQLPENVYQCFISAFDEENESGDCCGTGDIITF